jgi:hypothetical protein
MESMQSKWLVGLCLAAVVLVASCDSTEGYRIHSRGPAVGNGPPAHAKAHGYRRKQVCGYELVFDSSCGVYVVIGMSDCYYHDGYFYRLHGDVWEISVRADGDWRVVGHDALPPGLRAKAKVQPQHKVAAAAPGNPKSHGKAKGIAKNK